jgi:hypothetical protein
MIVTARLELVRPMAEVVTADYQDTGNGVGPPANLPDLLAFRFVLTTEGANSNDQFFVDDELAMPEVYMSPVGEPVDEDHDQSFHGICGEITTSAYMKGGPEGLSYVGCTGNIFADLYPRVATKVIRGVGRWAAVSMEAIPNPLEKVGKYLVIHAPKFCGVGLVRFPGNRHSKIHEVGNDHLARTDGFITRQELHKIGEHVHEIVKCACGSVIQCRCRFANKPVRQVAYCTECSVSTKRQAVAVMQAGVRRLFG